MGAMLDLGRDVKKSIAPMGAPTRSYTRPRFKVTPRHSAKRVEREAGDILGVLNQEPASTTTPALPPQR